VDHNSFPLRILQKVYGYLPDAEDLQGQAVPRSQDWGEPSIKHRLVQTNASYVKRLTLLGGTAENSFLFWWTGLEPPVMAL
jgi:hypothetical protein